MTNSDILDQPKLKFDAYEYERPNLEAYEKQFNELLGRFKSADTVDTQNKAIEAINQLRSSFSSYFNICYVRHTINTADVFYEKEKAFFDENNPRFESLVNQYYEALLSSQFIDALKEKWGAHLFTTARLSLKTFKPEIMDDLKEENRLVSEYVKIKAAARINFRGKEYTLPALVPLKTGSDRETRKAAQEAHYAFFEKHKEAIGNIYDKLVKVRHKIATTLGYDNFVSLAYDRLSRSDYNAAQVANFRKQIKEYIVPIVNQLVDRQRKRLGIEDLKYYDLGFKFKSGNPTPKGSPEWIVEQAEQMYSELSKETDQFFSFMQDNGLMDLINRDGKATGGYCTYIPDHKAPYIFSNFNGTDGDINVLTHEAGHAFQVYSSRDVPLLEYTWPTYEACEIHSMSMEFFTWPWMKLFFKEDNDKFLFMHMSGALSFLPYGVAVDEFQHYAYAHPEASPEERNQAWLKIEKKYLPHRDYNDNSFLKEGCFWYQQSHIFSVPFYYIDYCLAQICAFQFWKKDRKNHETAWNDYVALCKRGGSDSFLNLVKSAGLISPFEDGCVESVSGEISEWLEGIDDSEF